MWTCTPEPLSHADGRRYAPVRGRLSLTYAEAVRGWQADGDFRLTFNRWLADAPFHAFRWETPAVTAATADRPFEFVVLNDPGLSTRPDPQPFAEHFTANADRNVFTTRSLGGDATLVVPCPIESYDVYAHLALFVRSAVPHQVDAVWREVGRAVRGRIGHRPLWVSTAGRGVAWLHVRLDDRPKYYAHAAYRSPPLT